MVDSPEQALKMLGSDTINDRFKAANYFIKHKNLAYKTVLIERQKIERVRHIKMALNRAISNIDVIDTKVFDDNLQDVNTTTDEALKKYLKAQAIHEFSGTIIHELSKRIGLLEGNLKNEFPNLEESKTNKSFANLKIVFNGIKDLQRSVEPTKATEFDLPQAILDIVQEEEGADGIQFNFEGEKPCLIRSNISILHLALSNGIRNSIEAIKQIPDFSDLNNIVICWGKSDHDIWISIIDNGIGFHGDEKKAFEIGNTNKDGHIGFGLGILEQCMETLGGHVELTSVASGGAKLVLRWMKN
ncbi:MAG: signal transduction histidine kinase [Cocleimonas sp.]|jgi:signal transduction histidine kinase